MGMIMVLDTLGSRYGMLPSEVMSRATTFDIAVMDAAIAYTNYRHDIANGKMPSYSIEELMKIKERANGD